MDMIDMRLFVAITLSEEIKETLCSAQDSMFDRGVRGNYTPVENMHLTLAFIGEYPDAEPVLDALSIVSFSPFDITLEGIGCFGDLWWAGIKESAPLYSVVRRVRRALAENEIPFDRKRFSPHVTLIRKASGRMPGIQIKPVSMNVGTVSLMRSDRGRNGMIYTELGAIEAQTQF
jgi:2'-5' RNA ligase